MKTIPQNLERKVRSFIFNEVEIEAEQIIESSTIYIEAYKGNIDLGFTLDIDYNHNLSLEVYHGDYFNAPESWFTGCAEVEEIRVYTEDEDYILPLTDKIKRELNFKF